MMRMSPSGSKRHRVKRMSTFSGQALPDQDGKPFTLHTSNTQIWLCSQACVRPSLSVSLEDKLSVSIEMSCPETSRCSIFLKQCARTFLNIVVTTVIHDKTCLLKLSIKATEQSEPSADWDDLQTLKWAQTVDPHQSEECELLLETYSMQVCLTFQLFRDCLPNSHRRCLQLYKVIVGDTSGMGAPATTSIVYCILVLSWLSMGACYKQLEV